MAEVRTIPLGGVDVGGNPLPPQGTFYVPGGAAPATGDTQAGGWETYTPPTPEEAKAATPKESGGWETYTPSETPKVKRQIGGTEAALTGAGQAITFGTAPAIAGLSEASGIASPKEVDGALDKPAGVEIIKPFVGAYNLLQQYLSDHPDPAVKEAYERGRKDAEENQKAAQEQHPYAYLGGQLAATAATLPFTGGAGGATTALGRVAQGVKAGGIGGGLFGAGEAIGEGGGVSDVLKGAGGGVAAGAALGGLFGSATEGVTSTARKVASVIRGKRDAEAEAGSRVRSALAADIPQVQRVVRDAPAIKAGREAGTPLYNVDLGGETARATLRAAANVSPVARNLIAEKVSNRYRQQGDRFSNWIRGRFSGHDKSADVEALQGLAAKYNEPAYATAYRAGARMPYTDELKRLTGSPSIQKALNGALEGLKDRGIVAGYKLPKTNPFVLSKNGNFELRKNAQGNTILPELAHWDQAVRNLNGRIGTAKRSGDTPLVQRLTQVRNELTKELDKLVPAYKQARAGAHQFFRAEDALEAGANFVKDGTISTAEGARAFAKMNPAEQELFRRGFASELANQIERSGRNSNVINSIFIDTPRASQRIRVALGEQGAKEFEALVRMETIVDRARTALGNSTTARQLGEMGMAGPASAIGLWEGFKGILDPTHLIAGVLILGGRHMAKQIDEGVAVKVAEMLMSDNPAILARGYKVLSENPVMQAALRGANDVSIREIINYARPSGVGAAGAAVATKYNPFSRSENAPHQIQGDYGDYQNPTAPQPVQ